MDDSILPAYNTVGNITGNNNNKMFLISGCFEQGTLDFTFLKTFSKSNTPERTLQFKIVAANKNRTRQGLIFILNSKLLQKNIKEQVRGVENSRHFSDEKVNIKMIARNYRLT